YLGRLILFKVKWSEEGCELKFQSASGSSHLLSWNFYGGVKVGDPKNATTMTCLMTAESKLIK
ncbi:MAG: hypothetical protein ACKO96_03770, partial [Flammeovirgaceae bacterium]